MKFLISNYSTPWNTEPFYINATLTSIGEESKIFNMQQNSIYDEFDKFEPDIFICHISHLSKDVIHYIIHNTKITLMVNINNIDTSKLQEFNEQIQKHNISIYFFGNDDIELSNYTRIQQGADIFLNAGKSQYSIEKLIFVEKEEDLITLDGTYHYTTINQELFNKVDFVFPIDTLNSLFQNYKEIIFKGGSYIGTQTSFNAIYSGTKVIFDTKEPKNLDKINDIFKGQKLLSSVKNQHTCFNRIKTLLSQFNYKDILNKLEEKIGTI